MSPTLPAIFTLVVRSRMVAQSALVVSALCTSACTLEPQTIPVPPAEAVKDPLVYADPRIGSGGFGYANGSAFPGAAAPFGLAKVGPDTRGKAYGTITFLHYSGYWAEDEYIQGFSHLHLHGTGATDYGILGMMPLENFDASRTTQDGYESHFDKATETASPGYYAVTLDQGNIRAEMTATPHGAHHRYTYPAGTSQGHVVFDLAHHLNDGEVKHGEFTLDATNRRITGMLHHDGGMSDGFGGYDLYFDIVTRDAWTKAQVFADGAAPVEATTANGAHVGWDLAFDLTNGEAIDVQVGISLVSAAGAEKNRLAELSTWDFDTIHENTANAWLDLLGRMKIWGGTEAERRMFYSSLYRCFLMPTGSSDVDGQYRYGGQLQTANGFTFLTDQSLWDTYRTLTPMYALIDQDASRNTVESLHAMAKISGFFPKWPIATGEAGTMLGSSADVVVADAYVKGVRDFDAADAYAILRAAALDDTDPSGGRGGRQYAVSYNALGYVPANFGRSVSHTLEFGHDDLAMANFARALGKTDDAAIFDDHAKNYQNLFDPETGFVRAKDDQGKFVEENYNPYMMSDHYAEANGWHSLWAQHDIPGLAELFGGQKPFVDKLTQFFEEGVADLAERPIDDRFVSAAPRNSYWHSNEPCIHAAYAFAQVGRADLTQKYARWAAETHYNDLYWGLPGNDDGGTMSAWYLFTTAGIYPIPGTNRYVLGTPFFPRMEIKVAQGTLVIMANGVSEKNIFVQSVRWNDESLDKPEISHDQISQGGTLVFEMGDKPGSFGVGSN